MNELKLAVRDEEFGARIQETRVLPPDERDREMRLRRVQQKIKAARADVGDDETAKQLRARLESALDDTSELLKLEEKWLDEAERVRLGEWIHEPDAYVTHDEASAIAEFVILTFRRELQGHKIAVVFQRQVPPANRRERMGTAMKLPGKMSFLSGYEAVITLAWEHWIMLTDRDRQRLIHHELEHLVVDDGLKLVGHDFEDFTRIIELYGLRSESERFPTDGATAEVLMSGGSQLTLLEEDEAA